jgi:hypothetical protein
MKLTQDEIALLTADGFNQRYEDEIKNHPGYRQCYEALERELMELIGQRRYSSYQNFKSCRSKILKRKLSMTTGNNGSN